MAPGTPDAIAHAFEAERVAGEIGYPVLVKAAAGGGGKGMRVVEKPEGFASAFKMAQSEARNAFGDERVYIEKYFSIPGMLKSSFGRHPRQSGSSLRERVLYSAASPEGD